jgi:hypothetical protein
MKNESVLFVSDYFNYAIRRIDLRNHSYVSTSFGSISLPSGLAIDKNESFLYVASAARVIYKLSLRVQFPIKVSDSMIIAGSKTASGFQLF